MAAPIYNNRYEGDGWVYMAHRFLHISLEGCDKSHNFTDVYTLFVYLCAVKSVFGGTFMRQPCTSIHKKLVYMKRNLLTLVFITLVSLTAGAQAVCESHKELPKTIDLEIVDIDPALFKTQLIQPEPVCKAMDEDSYLSKQKHLFVNGADTPYTEGTEKVPFFYDQNGKCLRFVTSLSANRLK